MQKKKDDTYTFRRAVIEMRQRHGRSETIAPNDDVLNELADAMWHLEEALDRVGERRHLSWAELPLRAAFNHMNAVMRQICN